MKVVRQLIGLGGRKSPMGCSGKASASIVYRRLPPLQKLKHFVTDTLNFEAYARLIATILAIATVYSAALVLSQLNADSVITTQKSGTPVQRTACHFVKW